MPWRALMVGILTAGAVASAAFGVAPLAYSLGGAAAALGVANGYAYSRNGKTPLPANPYAPPPPEKRGGCPHCGK